MCLALTVIKPTATFTITSYISLHLLYYEGTNKAQAVAAEADHDCTYIASQAIKHYIQKTLIHPAVNSGVGGHTRACTHTHIHTHAHAHAYTYTHTHTHMHTSTHSGTQCMV